MATTNRRKAQITASVPPWLKIKCLQLAEGPHFTSVSEVVVTALVTYFVIYDIWLENIKLLEEVDKNVSDCT
jgi:hypothetical protein